MRIKAFAFVGIPVTDMQCAREFYEGVLGLQVEEEMMGESWTEYAVGNGTLALASLGDQWRPSDQGTSAAFEVENFAEALQRLKDRQIPFEQFESPCCHMAAIQDPDGNKLVIHKLKPENVKGPCS